MQDGQYSLIPYLVSVLVIVLVACKCYHSHNFHKRLSKLRNRRFKDISQDKIIVACEPLNLFFRFSTKYKPGYSEIIIPAIGWEGIWARFLRMLGKGFFYRLKESQRNIIQFLETLSQHQKIELFLYTTLPLQLTELILERLKILQYFPEYMRRSCTEMPCEQIKHPIEVDVNTKRVLILTSSREDHHEEDNKYFLIVKKQEMNLAKTVRLLEKLVDENQEIDQFHNQLAVVKANIESEPETAC